MNYYNEIDAKAAAWLRELIASGQIPPGDVDTRSITEVLPHEIANYTQCHFFAGIGGWSLALELAGWPADRPVWTGSCPCQPFSSAGQGKGGGDDRHLWPVFHRLVSQLRPERVFGEQVAQAIGFNWLDGVSADLEADGYAVGAVVLGAHSVGAPHIRQRLYWVADMQRKGRQGLFRPGHLELQRDEESVRSTEPSGVSVRLGDSKGGGCGILRDEAQPGSGRHAIGASWARFEVVQCRDGKTRRFEPGSFPLANGLPGRVGLLRGYGNAIVPQVAAEFVSAWMDLHEGKEAA